MKINEKIRLCRKSKGLLMQYVAEQSNMNYKKLSRLELGLQPIEVNELEAISKALGVNPGIFFADEFSFSQNKEAS